MAAQHRVVLGDGPMLSSLPLSDWKPGFYSRWPLSFPEGCVLSYKNRTVGPTSPRVGHAHHRPKPLCARHSSWGTALSSGRLCSGRGHRCHPGKPRATANRSGLEAPAAPAARTSGPRAARSFLCGARGSEIWGFCWSRCPSPGLGQGGLAGDRRGWSASSGPAPLLLCWVQLASSRFSPCPTQTWGKRGCCLPARGRPLCAGLLTPQQSPATPLLPDPHPSEPSRVPSLALSRHLERPSPLCALGASSYLAVASFDACCELLDEHLSVPANTAPCGQAALSRLLEELVPTTQAGS